FTRGRFPVEVADIVAGDIFLYLLEFQAVPQLAYAFDAAVGKVLRYSQQLELFQLLVRRQYPYRHFGGYDLAPDQQPASPPDAARHAMKDVPPRAPRPKDMMRLAAGPAFQRR